MPPRPRLVDRWLEFVCHPPPECVRERQRLTARAARLVGEASLNAEALPAEMDVIVAGSGFMSLYFLGVHSALTALQAAGKLSIRRYAGASSGAQTPFELVLAGEDATLDAYLAHGLLADRHAPNAGLVRSAYNADVHWRAFGNHLIDAHADGLHRLDERVYVSVSRLHWYGLRNVLYSDWSARGAEFAKAAFYATGTLLTKCDGHWCTDGGATNNEPTFTDGARPQLLVRPIKCGCPLTMAMRYSFAQAVETIERGQDDALAFFGGGPRTADADGSTSSATAPCAALKLILPAEPTRRI